jgi:tetratricopeptide (TPR) repeat protein
VVGLAIVVRAGSNAALSGAPRLAAVYDSILNAQFDRVDAELATACPPAPGPACEALRAEAVWWEILIDPDNRTLDPRLSALAATAITSSAAWVEREPQRAEAWFYLAGAYTPLVQLRVLRGERLSAARDGRKIKDALERALQLNPDLGDAHLGIGLYHYYADVAPLYAKFLRWLFMLPGGDRVQGLKEVLLARERGVLLSGEADFQLQQIYLWYENRPRDALTLLESLDARYPGNPLFLQRIADVHEVYFHDIDASIGAWERLRDRAREHRVFASTSIAARADKKVQLLIATRAKK